MTTPINILIVEDSQVDEGLLFRELPRAGYTPTWKRVETEADFLAEIQNLPDIILSDYSMPQFTGLQTAELLQKNGLNIPFILISGTVGEEVAVDAMQHGATDYLLKDRIGRLGIAVERAPEQKRVRNERNQAEAALLKAGTLQRAIFNSAMFSKIATDAKGVIKIFIVGAERMLGYTTTEVINQITPADFSDPQEIIARAKALICLKANGYSPFVALDVIAGASQAPTTKPDLILLDISMPERTASSLQKPCSACRKPMDRHLILSPRPTTPNFYKRSWHPGRPACSRSLSTPKNCSVLLTQNLNAWTKR